MYFDIRISCFLPIDIVQYISIIQPTYKIMNNNIKKEGFTLVELLIVIAIIGILSSVVFASMNVARQKARDARRVSDIKQIQLALEMYQDANGQYPTDIYSSGILSAYMNAVPKDPSTGSNYLYGYYTTGGETTSYHLGATLEIYPNSAVFESDKDCNSTGTPSGCPISSSYTAGGFNGANDATNKVFDVTP